MTAAAVDSELLVFEFGAASCVRLWICILRKRQLDACLAFIFCQRKPNNLSDRRGGENPTQFISVSRRPTVDGKAVDGQPSTVHVTFTVTESGD